MRFSHYLNSFKVVTRRHKVELRHFAPQVSSEKHCIFLHGWASNSSALRGLRAHFQGAPAGEQWNFWKVSYDTTWQTFPQSAAEIIEALEETGHDFRHSILIGYSMGGLVARQMVAYGFPIEHLVSLCTPHHGPVRWMPVPTRGPRSMAQWSRQARELDRAPRDIENRGKYHLFAMTYRDTFGYHEHDGMVSKSSAHACKLSGIGTRRTLQLKYSVPVTAFMPIDPHWRGMFPQYITPALQHIEGLMEGDVNKPEAHPNG